MMEKKDESADKLTETPELEFFFSVFCTRALTISDYYYTIILAQKNNITIIYCNIYRKFQLPASAG